MKRLLALLILPIAAIAAVTNFTESLSVKQYKSGVLTGKTFTTEPICKADALLDAKTFGVSKVTGQYTYKCVSETTYVATFGVASSSSSSASSSSSSVSSSSSSASSASSSSSSVGTAACVRGPGSYVTTGIYDAKAYGKIIVANNNWTNKSGQTLWANDAGCWGVETPTWTTVGCCISSYPVATRGWTNNETMMLQLSTPGTNDWTTKAGLGIPVAQVSKAQTRWRFKAPDAPGARWMALVDVYFARTPTPGPKEFPPVTDLMIDQAVADQPCCESTFYAAVAKAANASVVTLHGVKYLVYVDENGENGFHQAGGHTIHLFREPTSFAAPSVGPNWGSRDAFTDVAAIIQYFRQASPKNDAGGVLKMANGSTVTSPLLTDDLYLTAINLGWEINAGTSFTTTGLCIAMAGEADC